MFSVNIDKLIDMTETERESYQKLVDTFLIEYGKECSTLALIGGGVKAFKMASMFIKAGNRVLFIDGDTTTEVFLGKYKLGKNLKGIVDYMTKEEHSDSLKDEMICVTNHEQMDIMFTGVLEDHVVTPEEEKQMAELLETYQKDYDYIIVDSDDEGEIAKYCKGTLVIIDEGDYSEISSENRVQELNDKGCNVLGVIINE